MPLPTDHAQRNAYILQEVGAGHADVSWVPLTVKGAAHEITLQVTADAVKVDGVRFGAGARLAQQVADLLGASLVTPKIMDLMFDARAVTLPPFPHYDPTRMEDTSWFVEHSGKIDRALTVAGGLPPGGIVMTTGKPFVLSNQATAQRGVNYGWHLPKGTPNPWGGVSIYPSVTLSDYVVQQPGTAHGLDQDDYCLDPDTEVLTSDLRWSRIGDVEIDDELIGFDEPGSTQYPRLRRANVLGTTRVVQDCYEIVTSKATVIASGKHRWAVRNSAQFKNARVMKRGPKAGKKYWSSGTRTGWTATEHLKVGQRILWLCQKWKQDESWDGAWMAGFLDGEAWLSGASSFGFAQNPGPILDKALAICRRNNIEVHQRLYSGRGTKGCMHAHVLGQRTAMRMIGTFRPVRFMIKSALAWEGRRAWGGGKLGVDDITAEILEIRPLGPREVVGIETDIKTFIAEGLLSHNSETVLLVAPDCGVDGGARKLQDVLTDPELSKLLSHEGPLRQLRQPGVAPLSPSAQAIEAAARAPGIATLAGAIIGGAISMNPAGVVAGAAVGSAIDARRRT